MKFRPNRVRELIQRELGALIQRELTFEAKLVTVHGVDLTPDFKNCHVFISAIGTKEERRDAVHKLAANRSRLQHELAKRVILKYTPALHFHLDDSIERGVRVTAILSEIDTVMPPPENPEPEWASEEDVHLFPDLPAYRPRDDDRRR